MQLKIKHSKILYLRKTTVKREKITEALRRGKVLISDGAWGHFCKKRIVA
jgi:hypothetical protein